MPMQGVIWKDMQLAMSGVVGYLGSGMIPLNDPPNTATGRHSAGVRGWFRMVSVAGVSKSNR